MQYTQHIAIFLGVLMNIGAILGVYVKITNRLTAVETKIDMLLNYKGLEQKLRALNLVNELDEHEKELAK